MAIVVTGRINSYHADIDTFSITTASFTPSANSLLVVAFHCTIDGSTTAAVRDGITVTDSSGLTWTQRLLVDAYGTAIETVNVQVWTAPVGASPSSMTVTIANTGSINSNTQTGIQIVDITGYNVADPVGASATNTNFYGTGATSLTLSGTPAAGSVTLAGRSMTMNGPTDNTAVPGSGWTEVHDAAVTGGWAPMQMQYLVGLGSTTVPWADHDELDTGAGGVYRGYGWALEIKEAAAAASTMIGTGLTESRHLKRRQLVRASSRHAPSMVGWRSVRAERGFTMTANGLLVPEERKLLRAA